MNKSISSEIQFDALSLGVKLYNYFDGFKSEEVQLFSYFSSVLFPYTRESVGEWSYRYTLINNTGFPFSADLNLAIEMHLVNGMVKIFKEIWLFGSKRPILLVYKK
jgi:hypothetical protein